MRRINKQRLFELIAAACLLLAGCTTPPVAPPGTPPPPEDAASATPVAPTASLAPTMTPAPSLQEVADAVVQSDGEIIYLKPGDPRVTVYLFTEDHRSIPSQVQIARMMLRLYREHGMHSLGLEGWYAAEDALPTAWAEMLGASDPGAPPGVRADVLTRSLLEGDLAAAEWLGLILPDIRITGLDDATLYAVTPLAGAENAPYAVLYAIALAGMSEGELDNLQRLFDEGQTREAYQFAYQTDEWCSGIFQRLQDNVNIPSAEGMIALLDEIKARAGETGANASDEDMQLLDATRGYFGVVAQRSDVMAAGLLALAQGAGGMPVSASVGAAHADRMAQLLTDAGISLVVVRPRAQVEGSSAGMLSAEAYARREAGQSALPEGSLAAQMDGRRRPRPASAAAWFQQTTLMQSLLVGALEGTQALHGDQTAAITPEESAGILSGTPAADAISWLNQQGAFLTLTVYNGSSDPTLAFSLTLPDGTTTTGEARLTPEAAPAAMSLDELLVAAYDSLVAGDQIEDGWHPITRRVSVRLESGSE